MSTSTEVLILRLDAPLMSFGAPIVDEQGKIQPYPAQSLITGLVANALGLDRSEHEKLQRLQRRLQYAVREDRRGQKITDFQTVDLTLPHMSSHVWTTSGRKERRTNKPREILYRDYWADAIYTIALTLIPSGETPTLDDVAAALKHPARPLFIGRKTCLPATPLFMKRVQVAASTVAGGLVEALADSNMAPLADCPNDRHNKKYPMWWPLNPGDDRREGENIRKPVTDQRDWTNQIHTGERWIAQGQIQVKTEAAS